jgi:hypothetical protein
VNAFAVVVVAKLQELAFEINGIPEQDPIEKLSPDRPNEALNKAMRPRDAGTVLISPGQNIPTY